MRYVSWRLNKGFQPLTNNDRGFHFQNKRVVVVELVSIDHNIICLYNCVINVDKYVPTVIIV